MGGTQAASRFRKKKKILLSRATSPRWRRPTLLHRRTRRLLHPMVPAPLPCNHSKDIQEHGGSVARLDLGRSIVLWWIQKKRQRRPPRPPLHRRQGGSWCEAHGPRAQIWDAPETASSPPRPDQRRRPLPAPHG
ncbi:hypothetical protein SORBI_3009G100050 [Sorghum bicolor]|nr:hypothetical protein SORBI_3009G100050 [Sorghum bicolor]